MAGDACGTRHAWATGTRVRPKSSITTSVRRLLLRGINLCLFWFSVMPSDSRRPLAKRSPTSRNGLATKPTSSEQRTGLESNDTSTLLGFMRDRRTSHAKLRRLMARTRYGMCSDRNSSCRLLVISTLASLTHTKTRGRDGRAPCRRMARDRTVGMIGLLGRTLRVPPTRGPANSAPRLRGQSLFTAVPSVCLAIRTGPSQRP